MSWIRILKRKKNVKNIRLIVLLLFAIIFCLISAEIILRAHYVLTYSGTIEDIGKSDHPKKGSHVFLNQMIRLSPYQKIVYELRPNLDVYFISPYVEPDSHVKTNSFGWREKEFSKNKDEMTIRIIGIGDSFMFGWNIDEKKRYMDILESKLNENFPEYNWETLIFAVPGYNLVTEVEVLKKYALDYNPDLIIYGYHRGDCCLPPSFTVHKKNIFSGESFIKHYLSNLIDNVPLIIFEKEELRFEENQLSSVVCERVPEAYKDLAGKDSFLKALGELKVITQIEELPIIFFAGWYEYPLIGEIPTEIIYFDAIKETGQYLNRTQPLPSAIYVEEVLKHSDLVLGEIDHHPSEIGHRLLADSVYNQLVKENFIEELITKKNNG